MRLDKFIANHSSWSRAQVKRLLKNKAVYVNDVLATLPDTKILPHSDRVCINGEALHYQAAQYFMLHKPLNVVCANTDAAYPTVLDLLCDVPLHQRTKLQIVGRLDVDTSGLVLLTDNGQWNHRVTSPRSDCFKVYEVKLQNAFDEQTRAAFEQGMLLEGESKPTLAAKLEIMDAHNIQLSICEGRYHQVKRMFSHTGNKVVGLHRKAIGQIQLDANLKAGEYRALSEAEIASV